MSPLDFSCDQFEVMNGASAVTFFERVADNFESEWGVTGTGFTYEQLVSVTYLRVAVNEDLVDAFDLFTVNSVFVP